MEFDCSLASNQTYSVELLAVATPLSCLSPPWMFLHKLKKKCITQKKKNLKHGTYHLGLMSENNLFLLLPIVHVQFLQSKNINIEYFTVKKNVVYQL